MVRNLTGDVILYEPFTDPNILGSFKFRKVATKPPENTEYRAEGEVSSIHPMQVVADIRGHACVFIPGPCPSLIMREAATMPHIHELATTWIKSLSGVHTTECTQGFAFLDDHQNVCFAQLE